MKMPKIVRIFTPIMMRTPLVIPDAALQDARDLFFDTRTALDCDDESDVTKPAAIRGRSSLCMKDADGDGFGDSRLRPFVAGTDCDDDNVAQSAAEEDCSTDFDDAVTPTQTTRTRWAGGVFADRDEDGRRSVDSKNHCVAEGVYTTITLRIVMMSRTCQTRCGHQ